MFIIAASTTSNSLTGSSFLDFLVFVTVVAGFIWFMKTGGFNLKKRYLLKHGVPVDAKVERIEKTIFSVGNPSRPVMEMDLSFEDAYKNKHEITIRHAFSRSTLIPDEGDKLSILIDPNKPERVMVAPKSA
jgi:hypothetical protein